MTLRLRSLILVSTAVGLLGGCETVAAERVIEPDTKPRPSAQPLKSLRTERPSLLEAEPLERALEAVTAAIRRGDTSVEIELLELRASAERLVLQAADPAAPERVLQWEYSQGETKGPSVVELRGTGKLQENLFPLESVYLKAIPRLCSIAVDHVDPQDGRVSHLIIRRNLPFSQDVRFRLFVDSPRRSGLLDANRFGHPLLG
ncbi:MAG TPA: hypothetical protein VI197_25115 [Polyangiaceae bacterium]